MCQINDVKNKIFQATMPTAAMMTLSVGESWMSDLHLSTGEWHTDTPCMDFVLAVETCVCFLCGWRRGELEVCHFITSPSVKLANIFLALTHSSLFTDLAIRAWTHDCRQFSLHISFQAPQTDREMSVIYTLIIDLFINIAVALQTAVSWLSCLPAFCHL